MMLGAYLKAAAAQPHTWGVSDCCTFPGDWCVAQGRADPMARWRGRYASEAEAMALIERDGGLLAMFTVGCAEAGLPEVDEPQRGDIGVLLAPTCDGTPHVGGIFDGRRWALLADPHGIVVVSAVAERVWRP